MKRISYYPTYDQAKTLLEENILVNFLWDRMFGVPYVFPCDKNSHFELEMMGIAVLDTVGSYSVLSSLVEEWKNTDTINEFEKLFKQYKGRPFNE